MNALLIFLYTIIGSIITFCLYYLRRKAGSTDSDDSFQCVVIGVIWPIAAPFAFALYFAEEMNRRK